MGDFETKHVYMYPSKPLFWIRFIDDNFMIWTDWCLDNFIQHLNLSHTILKFTFEASETSVSFLDTLIQHRKLYTILYNKPTDSHFMLTLLFLLPTSPKDRWSLQPIAQIKRICARDVDFEKNSQNILHCYCNRDYIIIIINIILL